MMAVMRRLVELEKEFCRATAEEVCLTRLAEKMKRELEALRFEAATQVDACEREQQQCCICYDVLPVPAGLGARAVLVTSSVLIVLCGNTGGRAVGATQSARMPHQHRMPAAVVEQRLFEELQQRFQEQLKGNRASA
jgi:hypothetical protein